MPDKVAAASERSSLRTFAVRLIACDARGRVPGDGNVPDAIPVCEKLRPHLTTLMGSTGFHALLSRALTIARKGDAGLRSVQVLTNGSQGVTGETEVPWSPQAMTAGSVVLVGTLLDLLVAFIGEPLTLRLLREVWPDLSPDDLEPSNGDTP